MLSFTNDHYFYKYISVLYSWSIGSLKTEAKIVHRIMFQCADLSTCPDVFIKIRVFHSCDNVLNLDSHCAASNFRDSGKSDPDTTRTLLRERPVAHPQQTRVSLKSAANGTFKDLQSLPCAPFLVGSDKKLANSCTSFRQEGFAGAGNIDASLHLSKSIRHSRVYDSCLYQRHICGPYRWN